MANHGTYSMYTNHHCHCDECKAANRAYSKAYIKKNPARVALIKQRYAESHAEEIKARHQERYAADLEFYAERARRYNSEHADRRRATKRVQTALLNGKLVRPTECENVGSLFGHFGQIEGHHEDYAEPLDITWLCKRCHTRLHKQRKREQSEDLCLTNV